MGKKIVENGSFDDNCWKHARLCREGIHNTDREYNRIKMLGIYKVSQIWLVMSQFCYDV